MSKLLLTFIIGMFLLSFTSAWTSSEFTLDSEKILEKIDTTTKYGTYKIEESSWYDPLQIWTKKTLKEIDLKENTDYCGGDIDCLSSGTIVLNKDGTLIDELIWKRSFDEGKTFVDWKGFTNWKILVEEDVDVYETQCIDLKPIYDEKNDTYYTPQECSQVLIGTEKQYNPLDFKKEYKAGTYNYKIEGNKKPSTILDWVIKTNGEILDEWAVWGAVIGVGGVEASVTLNSPANNSIQYTNIVTVNASANVTGGAYLVNASLNQSVNGGAWEIVNTTLLEIGGEGLVSYYTFDETSGTTAYDSLGLNTGTNNGATINQVGKIGTAYSFDGNDDYISNTFNTTGVSSHTINMWVKFDNINTGALFENRGTSTGRYGFSTYLDGTGKLNYGFAGANYQVQGIWNKNTIALNNSDFIMLTFVGTGTTGNPSYNDFKLYINGVEKNKDSYLNYQPTLNNYPINAPYNLNFANNYEYSTYFDGIMDEVGIWNRSLDTSEITQLYNSGAGSRPTTTTTTFTNTYSAGDVVDWNMQFCDSDGDCGQAVSNYRFTIDPTAPTITLNYPTSLINYGKLNGTLQLNFTATDTNLDKVWYNYNGTNISVTGAVSGVYNISNITLTTDKEVEICANDTAGNEYCKVFGWDYKVWQNIISYSSPVIEGEPTQINGSFTLSQAPTSIKLIYDGVEFIPSLTSSGLTYNTLSSVYAPQVTGNENISFYYEIVVGGETIVTDLYEHLVLDLSVSTNCSGGTFPLLTFLNFDEDTRLSLNGTVEYSLSLLNNNIKVANTNGTTNGFNVSLCTNLNLSQSFARYELGLRYYKASEYFYETYNIEDSAVNNIPLSINLYFLNMSKGVQFKINYKDFNYLTHPGALVQIQRQYLDEDLYRLVELPKISDEGQAIGAFSIDNVRYKLIVIEDGEILDIFENIFPVCQNIVLGTCELNLRGDEEVDAIEDEDFIYSIAQGNNSITLTYVIPSGTPKSVSLSTTQDSRFINNLSSCTQTQFGSGGTLTCDYNNTVGDSLIDVEVVINGVSELKGTLKQQENLQPFFLTNNYFIAFILLLTLALIFISSGVMMVLSGVVGLFYLGFIYLINASSLNITTVASSIIWLLIAVGLILYKIAQKEERT